MEGFSIVSMKSVKDWKGLEKTQKFDVVNPLSPGEIGPTCVVLPAAAPMCRHLTTNFLQYVPINVVLQFSLGHLLLIQISGEPQHPGLD